MESSMVPSFPTTGQPSSLHTTGARKVSHTKADDMLFSQNLISLRADLKGRNGRPTFKCKSITEIAFSVIIKEYGGVDAVLFDSVGDHFPFWLVESALFQHSKVLLLYWETGYSTKLKIKQ